MVHWVYWVSKIYIGYYEMYKVLWSDHKMSMFYQNNLAIVFFMNTITTKNFKHIHKINTVNFIPG